MPWRKYPFKEGKYGNSYRVARGVTVRCDNRKVWTVFIEKDGDRKNRTVGNGREGLVKAIKVAEAIAVELDAVPAQAKSSQPVSKTPQFEDYATGSWLQGGKRRWRESTQERYEELLRLHILPDPAFKGKALDEIHRRDIKGMLARLSGRRSPATVEAVHSVLYGIFDEAVDDEWLEANPASKLLKRILPPKNKRDLKEPDPFDLADRDLFLETATRICNRTEATILHVMAHAGLRLGEALAMTEGDLDFRKRTYHVTQSFKEHAYSKPKTDMSRRFVDLPDFLVDDIKRHILLLRQESLQAGKGGDIDLLFPDPADRWKWPYSQRKIQGVMKKVCRKAGLRRRNPHDLRHTYASILLMAHQSPAYVQKQLGHSSITITVDTYGHWIPGEGRDGLEEALRPPVRQSHIIAYEQERPR